MKNCNLLHESANAELECGVYGMIKAVTTNEAAVKKTPTKAVSVVHLLIIECK